MKYVDLAEFRPLGLALELRRDTGGALTIAGIQDHRDDPEGVYFADDVAPADKAALVQAEVVRRRDARQAALGFWIQPADAPAATGEESSA